jgi:HEAT repeats
MKRLLAGLLMMIVLVWTAPVSGQLFAKKQKAVPSQRVPELILTVKTDPAENKRAHAAEELHNYDATTFTEIVPVLVDVLQHDKKASVRFEAVNSLAKIRPVSTLAGQALEKAAADDEAWRVRLHAKTVLPKYHLAGYSSKKADTVTAKKPPTAEPPIANPPANPPIAISPLPMPRVSDFPRPLPPGDAPKAQPSSGPSLFP